MSQIIKLLYLLHREINTMLKMQSSSMYEGEQKSKVDKYIASMDETFNSIFEKEKESSK